MRTAMGFFLQTQLNPRSLTHLILLGFRPMLVSEVFTARAFPSRRSSTVSVGGAARRRRLCTSITAECGSSPPPFSSLQITTRLFPLRSSQIARLVSTAWRGGWWLPRSPSFWKLKCLDPPSRVFVVGVVMGRGGKWPSFELKHNRADWDRENAAARDLIDRLIAGSLIGRA